MIHGAPNERKFSSENITYSFENMTFLYFLVPLRGHKGLGFSHFYG